MTLLMTAGCANQPAVLATEPLWPFEQLEIRTSIGRVYGYVSRPQVSAERFVVVVKQPPCPYTSASSDRQRIGTSGIVWQQFKHDSLFFQFERPGRSVSNPMTPITCGHATGNQVADHRRAVVDAVEAVRRSSVLDGVPTTYIAVGNHVVAAEIAARDPRAESLVLIDTSFGAKDVEHVVANEVSRKTRLRM